MKKYSLIFLLFTFLFFLSTCKEGKYYEMFTEAKKSAIQQDSLILGIQFGMSQDAFFDHCKILNQEKKIYDSNGNRLRVARRFSSNDKNFQMNFYPTYINDELHRLEFECFHEAYATWNKKSQAKVIIEDVKDYFEKEFQVNMEDFDHEKFGKAYVNFTGNRRLRIYLKDEKVVSGEFLDMTNEFKK